MNLFHAVAHVDHHSADILQFTSDRVVERKVHEQRKYTRQNGSEVRTEHEFFGHVCDALEGIAEVLIAGNHTSLSDFKHYSEKHRPQTALRIVGYEVVNQPTEPQLIALARQYFAKYDAMAGTRQPASGAQR